MAPPATLCVALRAGCRGVLHRRNLSRMAGLVACGFAFSVMLAMNTGCAVKGQREVGLPLVKDGKPVANIVIAKEASRSAQFAAAELQYHIEKITGTQLPVVTDEEAIEGNRILIGASKATQALGLSNKDFKHQEYLVRFLPDTLVLMGKDKEDLERMDYTNPGTFPGLYDEQATCYAVYDFLERYCGVRWYLPTDLGLVCPRQETLVVKGEDVRREPAMKFRMLYLDGCIPATLCDEPGPRLDGREGRLFSHRQRRTGLLPYACNHSFYGYYKRHLTNHPDWFAKGYDTDMPAGMRGMPVTNMTDYKGYPLAYYPNMCYTSTGFVQQVSKRAKAYFETGETEPGEQAAGDYFALGPMDSTGQDKMCKCADCQKLLHKEPPCNKWRKQPFFWDDQNSDYLFSFGNKVAREVAKTHPDKYLTMFSYHQNYYPPTRESLEPNIAILFCIHAVLRGVPAMDRAVTELLNKWDAESKDRPKNLHLYFHRPGRANPFFPGFMAHNMVRQMKDYHRRGIRGLFVEPPYFPESAVKSDAKWAPIVNQLELYITYKLADDPTLDGDKMINEFFTLFYGAAAKPMQELYTKIEQVYCDPANYAFDQNYNGYQNKEIAWGKLGTKERMAEFSKLMEAAKAAAQTETEKKRVAIFEKSVWNRMQAGRAEYEATVEAKGKNILKSAVAVRLGGAVPNGDLDKVDWSQAGILKNWGTLDGKPTSRQLEGRLLHDGQFLYVQLQETMDTSKLICVDNGIWDEDDWEIFVGSERGKGYRQIGINAKGAHKALAYGEKASEWDSGARIVSDTKKPDCWVVRMAFPLQTLLPGGVKPGQTIYLNIGRGSDGDVKKALSWIPTFAGFQAPSQMGAVRLADKAGINATERTEGE